MWSLLRTRRWQGFTTLVIVAIVAFGFLSAWQWSRAEEERQAKNTQREQIERERRDFSDAVNDLPTPVSDAIRQPVEVTGTYDEDSTLLVRQRPLDGRNGFWVATLLRVDNSTTVWVNRGWIPATGAATSVVTPPPPPQGTVRVTGWLIASETTREEISDLPAGQVRWLDTAILPTDGATALPVYVERVLSEPADPDVLALPLPEIDETQNVSYAVQWLLFAVIAMSGWWYFLRREAREESTAASAPTSSV